MKKFAFVQLTIVGYELVLYLLHEQTLDVPLDVVLFPPYVPVVL